MQSQLSPQQMAMLDWLPKELEQFVVVGTMKIFLLAQYNAYSWVEGFVQPSNIN